MGQFGNQPDFATSSFQDVTPNNTISSATNLDSSVIYIGDNTTAGDVLVVIPAGTVGPSVISGFSSPGYPGSNGTGYVNAAAVATTTSGSGTGLTVDITRTSPTGSIDYTSGLTLNTAASQGYLNGDLITVTGGDANAVFRIVAAPGFPTAAQSIAFHGLQAGGFLPVTVDYILASNAGDTTTVQKLIAAK
tara:strand:+ start:389 stop:961 length:573 start_codon:yes stop_codon:yes gene_type:complete